MGANLAFDRLMDRLPIAPSKLAANGTVQEPIKLYMDKYDLYELLSGAQALFDDWNGVTGALHEGTSWHSELREGVIEDIVAYVYGKTLLLSRYAQPSEKPEPLTLGELRQMGGEPIWIKEFPPYAFAGYKVLSLRVVDVYGDIVCEDGDIYEYERYGKTWLAYRSKPKEEV